MPYTTVVAGTTITASWGNANVRDQTIVPFATAAARTSAVTSPIAGMVSYRTDLPGWEGYTGGAWIRLLDDTLYPAAAKITRTGAAQSITTSTATAISFDTTAVTSTAHNSGMVNIGANPTRITIVDAGLYLVTAYVGWAANTTGVRGYALRKGGTTTMAQTTVPTVSGVGNSPASTLTSFESLVATDYVELVVSQDSGGNLNTGTSPVPFLAVVRVSA